MIGMLFEALQWGLAMGAVGASVYTDRRVAGLATKLAMDKLLLRVCLLEDDLRRGPGPRLALHTTRDNCEAI
jgi:hypothetical protein